MTPPRDARPHTCIADDGAVLRGWVWEPAAARGTVLLRTPYGAWRQGETARAWARRGYRCVVQDVRGRHESDGRWHPYGREGADGRAAVDAVRALDPGLPVVLSGGSYDAHAALEAARAVEVDALVVLVPALGLAETAWDDRDRPQLRDRVGWWHQHGRGRRSFAPLSDDELASRAARCAEVGPLRAAAEWGWDAQTMSGWRRLWSATRVDLVRRYGDIDRPLLLVRGDDDFFFDHAGRLAASWRGEVHVVDGPWGHRLAADIADEGVRERLRRAGGIAAVLDAWLARAGLPAGPATEPRALAAGRRTRSVFDPDAGTWQHESGEPAR